MGLNKGGRGEEKKDKGLKTEIKKEKLYYKSSRKHLDHMAKLI